MMVIKLLYSGSSPFGQWASSPFALDYSHLWYVDISFLLFLVYNLFKSVMYSIQIRLVPFSVCSGNLICVEEENPRTEVIRPKNVPD